MRQLYCLLTTFLIIATTHAQRNYYSDSTRRDSCNNIGLSLLAGYNQGGYGFAELGLAYNNFAFCAFSTSSAMFASLEVKLNNTKTIGPKVGVWMSSMGLALGLNLIYYTNTNTDKSSMVFRPEMGVGAGRAKIVYGYNVRITKELDEINTHQVGLAWCFRLIRSKKVPSFFAN